MIEQAKGTSWYLDYDREKGYSLRLFSQYGLIVVPIENRDIGRFISASHMENILEYMKKDKEKRT